MVNAKRLPYYVEVLNAEYQARKANNARYSLRAFAKFLELHASALSRVSRGEELLTVSSALRVAAKLELGSEVRDRFLLAAIQQQVARHVRSIEEALGTAFHVEPLKLTAVRSDNVGKTS